MTDFPLAIEVYSDVICPWCYVGKRRLERALAAAGAREMVRVMWKPFELNPTMPSQGMDRRTYLEAKFGSLAVFQPMEDRLLAVAEEDGIMFAFDRIARTPNTLLAHRLLWWADQQGCQDRAVEALFRGYFTEGADIGSVTGLVALAETIGLVAAELERFLGGTDGVAEVKAEEAAGHRLGIRGVPYFVFNGEYGLSGAQPVPVFVSALERLSPRGGVDSAGIPERR